MPTYVSLLKFTQKGVETTKEGPQRLDAAKKRFKEAGAEVKAWYLVSASPLTAGPGQPNITPLGDDRRGAPGV